MDEKVWCEEASKEILLRIFFPEILTHVTFSSEIK